MRTFNDNFAVRNMGSPATWTAAAQYAVPTWVCMNSFRRAIFLPHVGELDADLTVAVYEATSAAGAGAQAVAGLTDSFVNGTDEGLPGILEVREADLTDGYRYINLLVTPGATDAFSCILLLTEGYDQPEVNTIGTDIAFNTGE